MRAKWRENSTQHKGEKKKMVKEEVSGLSVCLHNTSNLFFFFSSNEFSLNNKQQTVILDREKKRRKNKKKNNSQIKIQDNTILFR